MRNHEPSTSSQETRHSCPYPVSPGQMPVPPVIQNDVPATARRHDTARVNAESVPVGMLSPYFKDNIAPRDNFPLAGLSTEGTELINFRHHSNTALHEEDILLREQIPVALPIGFKTVDVQLDSSPSAPPPSYNELFVPVVTADGPTSVITQSSPIARDTSVPRRGSSARSEIQPIADTRPTLVPRNRTAANRPETQSPQNSRTVVVPRHSHPRVNRYQNISEERPTTSIEECSTWVATVFKFGMAFIIIVLTFWIFKSFLRV